MNAERESLHSAAWPDMFDSLQAAYAQLNETQFELQHRVAEVEETRELFERVVDSMSEALLLADRTGRIVRINRAASDLLGVDSVAVTGRPLAEVWPAPGVPATPWELTEQAPGASTAALDVAFPVDDGTTRHVSVSCGLLRDKFGAVSGLLLVARDVTALTRRTEAQQFLAEAGELLVRSLNVRKTLRDLARMCVPRLADWSVVAVRGSSGSIRLAAAHVDPDCDRRLAVLLQGPLRDPRWSPALSAALDSGETTEVEGPAFSGVPEAAALQRRFGGGRTAAVPLVARGRAIGAIGLVWSGTPAGRRAQALELAEELAQRAGLAVDNAHLHEAERRSRRSAQSVAERLQRVQNVTDAALGHLDLDGLLESSLERIADSLAIDVACVLQLDRERFVLIPLAVHGLPHQEYEEVPVGTGYVGRIALERRPLAVEEVRPDQLALPWLEQHGITSLGGLPLMLEGRVTGVLLVGSRERRAFRTADMTLLRLVADRVALAIDNSQLYERQRTIAETLQRSLLPHEVGDIPGLDVAARYLAGGAGLDVGGDWYDVIALPDGRASIVVGDVGGRGIPAAATMGKLRTALRTYAFEGFSPAWALEHLNLMNAGDERLFATAVYLVIDPATGEMTYASAGHLPPLVQFPDGSMSWLDKARWIPLGVSPPVPPPQEETVALPRGATILLYTDGLIERRTKSIDDGMARLEQALRTAPDDLEALVDHLLERLLADQGNTPDDVALLAMRMRPRSDQDLRLVFEPASLQVRQARHALEDWLLAAGVSPRMRLDLSLAAAEVCANAIEHPRGAAERSVALRASLHDDWLEILVRDGGGWKAPGPSEVRGFGLRIARELVDEITIEPSVDGTEVRLRHRVCRRSHQPPARTTR